MNTYSSTSLSFHSHLYTVSLLSYLYKFALTIHRCSLGLYNRSCNPHHKPRHLGHHRSCLFLSHHLRVFSRPWLFQPIPSGPLAHTKGAWCRGICYWCRGICYTRGAFCRTIRLLWTQRWGGIVGPTFKAKGKSTPFFTGKSPSLFCECSSFRFFHCPPRLYHAGFYGH